MSPLRKRKAIQFKPVNSILFIVPPMQETILKIFQSIFFPSASIFFQVQSLPFNFIHILLLLQSIQLY